MSDRQWRAICGCSASSTRAICSVAIHCRCTASWNGLTGRARIPCVLDVFIALTRLAAGDPPHPWWHYTAQRKALYGNGQQSPPERRRKR